MLRRDATRHLERDLLHRLALAQPPRRLPVGQPPHALADLITLLAEERLHVAVGKPKRAAPLIQTSLAENVADADAEIPEGQVCFRNTKTVSSPTMKEHPLVCACGMTYKKIKDRKYVCLTLFTTAKGTYL